MVLGLRLAMAGLRVSPAFVVYKAKIRYPSRAADFLLILTNLIEKDLLSLSQL